MKKIILVLAICCLSVFSSAQSDREMELYKESDMFAQQGDLEKAAVKLSEVLEINPEAYGALLFRAYYNEKLGRVEKAYPDLDRLIKLYPEDPQGYVLYAWYLMKAGKLSEAKTYAEKAYKFGSSIYYYCALNLGINNYLLGNKQRGEELINYSVKEMNSPQDFDNALLDLNELKDAGINPVDMQKIIDILTTEYNRAGVQYQKINEHDRNALAYLDEGKRLEATLENIQATDIALSLTPPDYEICMKFSDLAGYYYEKMEKPNEALKSYRQSVECIQKGKIFTEEAGRMANSAGLYAKEHNKLEDAVRFYSVSLDIYRELKAEEDIAILLSNLAEVNGFQGNYDVAIKLFEESIRLDEKNGRKDGLAITSNNLSAVLDDVGRYAEAIDAAQKAVKAGEELSHNSLSIFYSTLGNAYLSVGEFEKALEVFNKSYSLDKVAGNKIKMSQRLSSIGVTLKELGRHREAIAKLSESIKLAEEAGAYSIVANPTHNLGATYMAMNDGQNAKSFMEKGLELNRKYGQERQVAMGLTLLGQLYREYFQDNFKAQKYLLEAEGIFQKYDMQYELGEVYYHLSYCSATADNTRQAIQYAQKSVDISDNLREKSGASNVSYLSSVYIHYQALSVLYGLDKQYDMAFNTIEKVKAMDLSRKLAGKSTVSAITVEKLKGKLGPNQVLINYMNAEHGVPIYFTVTNSQSYGYMPYYTSDAVVTKFNDLLTKYEDEVQISLANQRGFKPKEKTIAVFKETAYKHHEKFEDLINYYRTLLINQSVKGNDEKVKEIATGLYEYLIDPIAQNFSGKKELIIIPEGILGYLPFETLLDPDGKYLVETYDIHYVHSATVWNILKARDYGMSSAKILALGGAVYDSSSSSISSISDDRALGELKNEVGIIGKNRGSMAQSYNKLGIGGWENLPGTLEEVNEIKLLFPTVSMLTGHEVSEDKIKSLSVSNALATYNVIHFATHGIVVPEVPELSALVLSQGMSSGEDGYLRAEEIEQLKLKADFVNLSACETGLGKIYGGEGVVGLTQSFLVAGANGLSVSLWQVADESTMQFMSGMYKKTKEGQTYSQAINAMKRDFIMGKYGDTNKSPYFWAPFAYYGN